MGAGDALVLWGIGTARTLRPHWILHELELPYEVREIQSRSGETRTDAFRKLNPREKIPVLQHGDFALAESGAIVNYLAEAFGRDRGLIPPAGSRERALYDQWCFFAAMELDAHTLYVLRRHVDLAPLYGEAPAAVSAARAYFQKQAAVAEGCLADGRPFILGDRFTGADIMLASCLVWAVFYGETLGAGLDAYRGRVCERPGYRHAFGVNFPPGLLQELAAQRRREESA